MSDYTVHCKGCGVEAGAFEDGGTLCMRHVCPSGERWPEFIITPRRTVAIPDHVELEFPKYADPAMREAYAEGYEFGRAESRHADPSLIDLVHELHEAVHGYSTARPQPPAEVWAELLAYVRILAAKAGP